MKIQAISSKNYSNLLDKIAGILVEAKKKVIRYSHGHIIAKRIARERLKTQHGKDAKHS